MFLTWFLYMLLCLQQSDAADSVEAHLRDSMERTKTNETARKDAYSDGSIEQNKTNETSWFPGEVVGSVRSNESGGKGDYLAHKMGEVNPHEITGNDERQDPMVLVKLNSSSEENKDFRGDMGDVKPNETMRKDDYLRNVMWPMQPNEDAKGEEQLRDNRDEVKLTDTVGTDGQPSDSMALVKLSETASKDHGLSDDMVDLNETVGEEDELHGDTGDGPSNEIVGRIEYLRDSIDPMKPNNTPDKETYLGEPKGITKSNEAILSEGYLSDPITQIILNKAERLIDALEGKEQVPQNDSVEKEKESHLRESVEHVKRNKTADRDGDPQYSMLNVIAKILEGQEIHMNGVDQGNKATSVEEAYTRQPSQTSETNGHNTNMKMGPNGSDKITFSRAMRHSVDRIKLKKSTVQMDANGPAEKAYTGAFMGHTEPNFWSSEFPHMPDPCHYPRRKTEVKDFLCKEPLTFLPSYKNPCWMGQNSRLRCLPYFHLFGMSKSGTTDLFARLYIHPEIVPNKGLSGKEVVFWTRGIFKTGNKSLQYYANSFYTREIEKAVDEDGYHYKITGHGDPHDMWERFGDWSIPQNNPTDEELMWTMPYVERHLNPGVKLLLMLRDPVERLYSVFYFAKQGNSSKQFDECVKHDFALLHTCLKYHTLRHCIFDPDTKTRFKARLYPANNTVVFIQKSPFMWQTRMYSSFYAELLRDWLRAFPREQILILRNEDYAKDIPGTMEKIFTFLNVSLPDPAVIKYISELPRAHVTKAKAAAEPMSRRTRMILTRLYKQSGEELAEMLGDEKFTFKDVQKIHR